MQHQQQFLLTSKMSCGRERNVPFIFIIILLFATSSTSGLPRCGDVFTPVTGGIFYKPFEPVLESERCAWILGVPDAIGYTFNVQFLGPPTNQPGSDQELVFTCFKHNGREEPVKGVHVPTALGSFEMTECNLVIVSFYSLALGEAQQTGFSVEYRAEVSRNVETRVSNLSTHHIFETPTFEFKYPLVNYRYDNNELAAFLFPPTNSIYEGKCKSAWYKKEGLQDTFPCFDSLFVYVFLEGRWETNTRICHDTSTVDLTYEDMVLVLFQTDDAETHLGFWFYFNSC